MIQRNFREDHVAGYDRRFTVGTATVEVYPTKAAGGAAAAGQAAGIMRAALAQKGRARIIIGTGNSQDEMIRALVVEPDLDWKRITVFHMDEYIGLPMTHPASFRGWLKRFVADVVHPGAVYYLNGEAPDLPAECRRYAELLDEAEIDICFIGFGENGHIAFNDPHVADFDAPRPIKAVEMDERCRMQQVGEGHFGTLADVPRRALSLSCPRLVSAENLICVVPEARKAEAVARAVTGPLSTECPATLVFTHPHCTVYLDRDSASRLES